MADEWWDAKRDCANDCAGFWVGVHRIWEEPS